MLDLSIQNLLDHYAPILAQACVMAKALCYLTVWVPEFLHSRKTIRPFHDDEPLYLDEIVVTLEFKTSW